MLFRFDPFDFFQIGSPPYEGGVTAASADGVVLPLQKPARSKGTASAAHSHVPSGRGFWSPLNSQPVLTGLFCFSALKKDDKSPYGCLRPLTTC